MRTCYLVPEQELAVSYLKSSLILFRYFYIIPSSLPGNRSFCLTIFKIHFFSPQRHSYAPSWVARHSFDFYFSSSQTQNQANVKLILLLMRDTNHSKYPSPMGFSFYSTRRCRHSEMRSTSKSPSSTSRN